jgi:biotin transporter BioY
LETLFIYGMRPFIIGDIIKMAIAGVTLPSTWRLVDRTTARR